MQKVIGELFVDDYTRKGYIDGVTLRLPTISVRPGTPNKAASSFASGIIREPLAGLPAVCPVSTDVRMFRVGKEAGNEYKGANGMGRGDAACCSSVSRAPSTTRPQAPWARA